MSGVMALRGITPPDAGRLQIQLQSKDTAPPVSMLVGKSRDWLSVSKNIRAMWGTASPIKAMGPQNAVTTAVSRLVTTSSPIRAK
mgnify:FL=1